MPHPYNHRIIEAFGRTRCVPTFNFIHFPLFRLLSLFLILYSKNPNSSFVWLLNSAPSPPIVLDDPKHIAHLRAEVHPILLRRSGKDAPPIGMIHHNLQGRIGRKQRLGYRVRQSDLDAMLPIFFGRLAVK